MSEQEVESLVTDEMRAGIGRTFKPMTSHPIAVTDIRKWAIAVYYPELPPRLYWDEEYAAGTPWGGIVAPQEFNPFGAAWMAADPEPDTIDVTSVGATGKSGEFEVALGVTPPPFKAVLQSKVTATYSAVRMRPGDVIRSESSITEYFERQGRMGLQLYTTVSENYHNQNGEWVKRLDTVYVRYR